MFGNWQGLNIWSYGNWIVSPLMEMCQTCSYTQQTTDSEWRSTRAREWRVAGAKTGIKICWILYFGCWGEKCYDEKRWLGHVVLLPLSLMDLFHLFLLIFVLWYTELTFGSRATWVLLVWFKSLVSWVFSQPWLWLMKTV